MGVFYISISCYHDLAGPRGFEPRSLVLETRILPLNYRPYCVLLRLLDNSKKSLKKRDFTKQTNKKPRAGLIVIS